MAYMSYMHGDHILQTNNSDEGGGICTSNSQDKGEIKYPQYLNVLDYKKFEKERKHDVFTSRNIIQENYVKISDSKIRFLDIRFF